MKKRKGATSVRKFKMVKFNLNMRRQNRNFKVLLFNLVVISSCLMIYIDSVEARKQEGDDIIMTKGKLIMRGGKGKGHLILDTGKSGDHEVSHMMPMMGHHFNPYSFYPMQHHQPQAPMIHVHPVYIEDHSAMHHHPEPSHHHEYQHHEEKHYPEHHGMEYQHHHEPHYQEMHHHQMHQEMHHQPEHHEEEQQEQQHHHEPMGHHYEQEAHHEEGGGGHHGASLGYESNPMMQMMMHGSGPQPAYDQLAALQALQHQALYAGPHFQDPASQQYQQHLLQNLHEQKEQQTQLQQDSKPAQAQQQQQQQEAQQQPQQQSNKPTSFFDQAGNNPLIAIIKPIFKRDPNKQKKP